MVPGDTRGASEVPAATTADASEAVAATAAGPASGEGAKVGELPAAGEGAKVGELPAAGEGAKAGELPTAPLVLYDGTCGFCATSVRWILAHERDHEIRFAPLQGATARLARERYPRIPATIDSVVYIGGGRAHLRSKAMLHAARHLRAPWRCAYAMRWFPGFVLDLAYRVIAALRYRIWGHADACQLVTPEQRARFLP